MKITALVENQSKGDLKAVHGLSLYIETQNHKILFDLGPDNTLFDNAKTRGIDLTAVDTVIISHGHSDHGGALKQFLAINPAAKIYLQKSAFDTHSAKLLFFHVNIGLDTSLKDNSQIILVEGDHIIDEELSLFTVNKLDKCYSPANDNLYAKKEKDVFSHEQHLLIKENSTALLLGCGHAGIVNIMEKAKQFSPQICVGGYHLFNPLHKKAVSTALLDNISQELKQYSYAQFYTCHCTGTETFHYLSKEMPNLSYLSCGETVEC